VLPPVGLSATALALRRAGLAFLSPQLLDLLRWGRTLSTARAAQVMGFTASMSTPEAFIEFVEQRRVLPFLPDRRTYLYERELEEFIHSRQGLAVLPESNGERLLEATEPTRPRPRRRRSPRPAR
jgi:hypothetical protein